jgi:hypothetical protein
MYCWFFYNALLAGIELKEHVDRNGSKGKKMAFVKILAATPSIRKRMQFST